MVINCANQEYLQSVKLNLENTAGQNYKVIIPNKFYPRIKIINAEATDATNDQLSSDIIRENQFNSLNNVHFNIIKKDVKNSKMNIIAEISPILFKKIMKEGFLFVGWRKCFVIESLHITRCFKCSGFGHLSINCKSSSHHCPNCTGSHRLDECNEKSNFTCINCVNHNKHFKTKLDINHSARDKQCSIYKNQVEYLQTKINYDE